jgi:LacI family transcriptional regulator, gluconate utilization system Gnt-I transcriptional repressor
MQANPKPLPALADPPMRPGRRGHGRATLADVALLAEVTKITVSRYLREPATVAPATAERIRQALQRTAYMPNKQAGLLASGRSRMVAALVPNLDHSVFGETVQALSESLQPAGLELLLASTGYSQAREEEQLAAVLGWAPAAIVVTGRQHAPGTLRLLQAAAAGGTPVLEIWDHHPQPEPPFAQIGFDHRAVGRAMARHLLAAGHRRLAYLDSSVAEDLRAHQRGAAFAATARAAGARVQRLRAATGDPFDAGRRALDGLRRAAGQAVSAVACANDQLGCGLLLEARARGLAVPGQLAVLGFGDFPVGRHLAPALSTVHTPSAEIGRATAQAVLAALQYRTPAVGTALPWALLARASTGG